MNVMQIKYVLEIARQKNFSKAANALFISQPTLSNQLKNLEDELQVKLFYRSTREVFLTKAGEEFCRYAVKVLEDFSTLNVAMEKYQDTTLMNLSIGYIASFTSSEPFQKVLSFLKKHPEINVKFMVELPEVLIDGLYNGNFDVIFTDFPEGIDMRQNSEVETNLLVNERCCLITAKEDPIQQEPYVTSEEIQGMDIIGIPEFSMKNRQTQLLFQYNSSFMQGRRQTVDMSTRVALVQNGMGVILGPKYLADYYNLGAVPIEPAKYGSGIHMVFNRQHSMDSILRKFRDYLLSCEEKER